MKKKLNLITSLCFSSLGLRLIISNHVWLLWYSWNWYSFAWIDTVPDWSTYDGRMKSSFGARALYRLGKESEVKRMQIDFLSTECRTMSNYAILVRICDLLEINFVCKNCWIEIKCWEWKARNIWKNQIDNRNMNGTRSLPKQNHYNFVDVVPMFFCKYASIPYAEM